MGERTPVSPLVLANHPGPFSEIEDAGRSTLVLVLVLILVQTIAKVVARIIVIEKDEGQR